MKTQVKIAAVALIVGAVFVVGGWDCGDALKDKGDIRGRVVNALDGAPIVGAEVSIDKESDSTGEDGRFLVRKILTGRRQLIVRATGYVLPGEPIFVSVAKGVRDIEDIGLVPVGEAPPALPGL